MKYRSKHCHRKPKMDNTEIYLIIILVKLSVICLIKFLRFLCSLYQKHNEIVLKKNFPKYKESVQAATTTTNNQKQQQIDNTGDQHIV